MILTVHAPDIRIKWIYSRDASGIGLPAKTADTAPAVDRRFRATALDRLLGLIAPRPLLLLSASEDRYSADALEVVQAAIGAWEARGAREMLQHIPYKGGPALAPERTEVRAVGQVLQLFGDSDDVPHTNRRIND
jgi:hypothetical protein